MEEAFGEEDEEVGKMERKDEKEKSLPWGPTGMMRKAREDE